MLSTRSIYQEIRSHDETFQLFCSIAAKGETQGGWENERIAALCPDAELAAKIARHGADEDKHGRLFLTLLKKRGLDPVPVPDAADYIKILEHAGLGIAHDRLREEHPLSEAEVIAYLVHGRVTEQRGAEEIAEQRDVFRDDPELGKAIRMIADDEVNHLAHCHEELLRLVARGHGPRIHAMLRHYAKVEIRAYRDVSLAVMRRMGEALCWPAWKRAVLAAGIHAVYWSERLWRWRRMVTLRMPERRNALGTPGPVRG